MVVASAKPTKKGITTDKQSTKSSNTTSTTITTTATKKSTKSVSNNSKQQNEGKKEVVEQKSKQVQVEEEYSRPISGSKSLEKINENEWFDMNLRSGGSFINIPPILIDQSNLLLSNNNTIKIYNPTSGQLKSQVSLESNNEMITYISSTGGLNSAMTIYLSSSSGKFYQYDINKKEIAPFDQENNNKSNNGKSVGRIIKFLICPVNQNIIYFITEEGELFKYNRLTSEGAKPLFNNTIKQVQFLSISRDGKYLVVANKSLIQVLNLEQSTIVSSKNYKSEYHITSLSVVPVFIQSTTTTVSISFGTTLGRLNFINYNKESNQITFSSYNHWHSTPLISNYYNYDGTLLFTGAYENTLAIWTVSTMRRKVLPRLGASIVHINCDPLSQLLAITLSNNKVQIINVSDFKSCSIITGLQGQQNNNKQLLNVNGDRITSFIEPITNNLIFSGQKNGVVQFYNIKKDRVEKEIIVSPPRNTDISTKKSKGTNLSSNFNPSKLALDKSNVEPLAFHNSKPLFASFESYSGQKSKDDKLESKVVLKDQILKFWESFDNGVVCKNTFSIISPHQSNILSMSFHPTKNILLTASEKDFKLWKKQSMEAIDGETQVEKSYWTCYHESNYRNLPCKSTAFSNDGLIYAIACGHLVTLWETESNSQIDILSFSSRHVVSELSFLDNNQLLVSYKENGAIVWDISTKKPTRVYNFAIKPFTVCQDYYALSPESSRNRIMIFSNKTHQLLFNTLVSVPKSQVVEQILFSKDDQYDCILCITNENLIFGFTTLPKSTTATLSSGGDVGIIPSGSGVINQYVQTQNYIKSIKENKRQKVLSSTSTKQKEEKEKEESMFIGKEIFTKLPSTQEMFGAASHIMPGVQNIYQQYMDSILVNNNNLVKKHQSEDNNKESIVNINNNNNNDNSNDIDENSSNNNNVKTTTTTTTTINNSNKFSSMKNFFDTLDEEQQDEQKMETTSNDTASASTNTSTKNKSKSSSSSASSKKRKEIS